MHNRILSAGLVALAALLTSQRDAQAALVTFSFTGTIVQGYYTAPYSTLQDAVDTGNYFGGGILTGKTISGTLSYDSSAGLTTHLNDYGSSGYEYFFGTAPLTVSLTVSGHTVGYTAGLQSYNSHVSGGYSTTVANSNGGSGNSAENIRIDARANPNTTNYFSDVLSNPLQTYAFAGTGIGTGGGAYLQDTFSWTLNSFSESFQAAAVPEPTSLALLGAGTLALVRARRRRA